MTMSPPVFRSRPAAGFTLVELVIAMAIVAILAAIAYPSYGAYTRKAHRADAQQLMMDMAVRQGEIMLDSRAYATTDELAVVLPVPDSVSPFYTMSVELPAAGQPPSFVIKATAKGGQTPDGDLTLTSAGVKGPAGKW